MLVIFCGNKNNNNFYSRLHVAITQNEFMKACYYRTTKQRSLNWWLEPQSTYIDFVFLLSMETKMVTAWNKVGVNHFVSVGYQLSNFCCFDSVETSGPAFEEFLDLIGERVTLKGFERYRAQLDNRSKLFNEGRSSFFKPLNL